VVRYLAFIALHVYGRLFSNTDNHVAPWQLPAAQLVPASPKIAQ
jgi:hypothetical protein